MRYKLLGRVAPGLRARARHDDVRRDLGLGASTEESRASFDAFVERAATSSTRPATTRTATSERSSASLSASGARAVRRRDQVHADAAPRRSERRRQPAQEPRAALESSLRRLGTDYVDLFWLHMWDGMTPFEEVLRGFDDLVSSGKALYVALSDTPAWVVSQAVTMADRRGWARPVARAVPLCSRIAPPSASSSPWRRLSTSLRRPGGSSRAAR